MPADNVVGQAIRPSLTVVIVAVGEDVVARRECDRERVSLAGRHDLQPRAVGPDADHAATLKLNLRPVETHSPGYPLVADGDVQETVHAQANSRGDVVVHPAGTRHSWPEPFDQVDACVRSAVAVGVAERREKRRVDDVERPVDPLEPHHAPEPGGERPDLSVPDRNDRVDRRRGRTGHVHRIRAQVERAVGRGDDRGRIHDPRRLGDQLDRPSLRHRGQPPTARPGLRRVRDRGPQEHDRDREGSPFHRCFGSMGPVMGQRKARIHESVLRRECDVDGRDSARTKMRCTGDRRAERPEL